MDLLILRPLATGLLEYLLAGKVLREGKFMHKEIALLLFFLGSYQLSEYLYFTQGYNKSWLVASLVSTTMLPPFGLMIIERLSGKETYYKLFFTLSIMFGGLLILFPQALPSASECNCFMKYDYSGRVDGYTWIFTYWSYYYVASLTLSMGLILKHIFKKVGDTHNLRLLLLGYASFFPLSIVLTKIYDRDLTTLASVMCSLAIFMAFITTRISLNAENNVEVSASFWGRDGE